MKGYNKDVNLEPNWAVLHEYFERIGGNYYEEFLSKLPIELANRCKDMSRVRRNSSFRFKYPDTWEPVATWNVIEEALIDVLGHGHHLRAVGRHSRYASFGLDALKAGFVATPIGRFLTSPADGYQNVGLVAKRNIRNKSMGFIQTEKDKGFVVMQHHRDIADPLDDFWSISTYIPGHGDAVNLFWHQDVDPRAMCTVIAISVVRVLNRYAPHTTSRIVNGKLVVDNEIHGEVTYIKTHESGFVLSGDDTIDVRYKDTIPCIRITKDIVSPCRKCSHAEHSAEHPVLKRGQILQFSDNPEHQLPNSAFSVFWKRKWVDNVRRFSGNFVMKKAVSHAEVEAELSVTKHQLLSHEEFLVRSMPTRKIAKELSEGRLEPFACRVIVMQTDIVGFTELSEKRHLSAIEQARLNGGIVMNQFRIARPMGGWSYKAIGDSAVIVFTPHWPKYENEALTCTSLQQAAKNALRASYKMHQAAVEKGLRIRVGIHVDNAYWQDNSNEGINDGWMDTSIIEKEFFEGGGDAFNKASRLEKYAESGATAVSQELLVLAHGQQLVEHVKKEQIEGSKLVQLSGGFSYQGNVRVKGSFIDVWMRIDAKKIELPEEVFGHLVKDLPTLPGIKPVKLFDE